MTNDPTASTSSGTVRGRHISEGAMFLGIPYAAPPVADLRFLPPMPPTSWTGEHDCTTRAPEDFEDRLYLNIWTPATDAGRRPVLVWVGKPGKLRGNAFARDGVVLVTASVREGLFASVYLSDDAWERGSGNLSLLDLIAVLSYVHENIEAFGGNPQNVTVAGCSHGGRASLALMVAPEAAGLVRRAVPMSLPRHPWRTKADIAQRSAQVARSLGLSDSHYEELRSKSAADIVAASRADERLNPSHASAIDGVVLPGNPLDLIKAGNAARTDVMTGWTAEEARYSMFGSSERTRADRSDPTLVRRDISKWFAPADTSADEVIDTYGRNRPGQGELDVLAAVSTDHFKLASLRLAEAQLPSNDNVFVYRFSWRSRLNGGVFGAYHGFDVQFAFDSLNSSEPSPADLEALGPEPPNELASAYHGAFVAFATSGDPASGSLPKWPAYNTSRRPVMEFADPPRVLEDPESDERLLWDGTAVYGH